MLHILAHPSDGNCMKWNAECRLHVGAGDSASESKQFETLHQHIDDLTREKFELARGLQKQQEMSSSLAEENQRLLDDYNDQVES